MTRCRFLLPLLLSSSLLLAGCSQGPPEPACACKLVLSGLEKKNMTFVLIGNEQSQGMAKMARKELPCQSPGSYDFNAPPDMDITVRVGPWENGRMQANISVDGRQLRPNVDYKWVYDAPDFVINFHTPKKAAGTPTPTKH